MISARAFATCALLLCVARLRAHDGPPFPILSDQAAGPYIVSIWTDPDTTDDGSAGGQFWVRLSAKRAEVPAGTRATVTVTPVGQSGPERRADASPVNGDLTNQFAAVVMDHEGKFAVHVVIDGPLGTAAVDSAVEATYSLRPPRSMVLLYLAPFITIGVLWGRLLIRRRAASDKRSSDPRLTD
jgi:hypothetical protein